MKLRFEVTVERDCFETGKKDLDPLINVFNALVNDQGMKFESYFVGRVDDEEDDN